MIKKRLKSGKESKSEYQDLTFEKVEESVKLTASELGGYQVNANEPDLALDFCHKLGVLHTEYNNEDHQTRYIFASQLHLRYDLCSVDRPVSKNN